MIRERTRLPTRTYLINGFREALGNETRACERRCSAFQGRVELGVWLTTAHGAI